MINRSKIKRVMRKNIYSLIINHTKNPPICKICEKVIEVKEEYIHKNTRLHVYGAFYCIPCAEEKNII